MKFCNKYKLFLIFFLSTLISSCSETTFLFNSAKKISTWDEDPMYKIGDPYKINGKWLSILSILKHQWENGNRDIYCHFRLNPEPEYILQTMDVPLPPLGDKISLPKDIVKDGEHLVYRAVDVEELFNRINDKHKRT